ncbi:MAG: esterase/lipase [Parasphingorhabdus sp.]|jgi:esterase/lipase
MIVKSLLFLFLLVVQSGCFVHSHSDTSEQRPANNDSFPAPSSDFSVYRENLLGYLKKYSLPDRTEADIRLNLPFELPANKTVGYQGKFLLIHGLNDSAYVWRDMAQSISQRGFDVRAVLLPGHGSHPAKMLDVSYRQWLSATRLHLSLWNVDETPMYLGGFSLGGVIASILALENSNIAGLLLVSPAFHSRLDSKLRWAWLYAKFKPWMFGGLILEDNPIKYNSIPINSGKQYYNTTKYLKDNWGKKTLNIPVLMVASMNDSVVDVEYTRQIFQKRFISNQKKLILYSNNTSLAANQREVIRPSEYPKLRIINQAHLSLINSPDNSLLGKNGTQLICNGNEYPIFMACMRASGHWYGAQHTESPDAIAVARTTYNPDFDTILKHFDQVFQLVNN